MNVGDYLARINYSGSLKPNLETLTDLTWAHKTSVPYSNAEYVSTQGVVDFGVENIYQKIVSERAGAICYQLNRLFGWLLEQLGFQVSILLGSFYDDSKKDWSRWGGHSLICVSMLLDWHSLVE